MPNLRRAAAVLCLLLMAASVHALDPKDVYLIVNQNVLASRELAEHYCKMRGVSESHIVALDLPPGEDISRRDYDTKLAAPLREKLADKKAKVKVLLMFYGVPLRVGGAEASKEEKAELEKLQKEAGPLEQTKKGLEEAIKKLESAAKKVPEGAGAKELQGKRKELGEVQPKLQRIENRRRWLNHHESLAAVDSELALLWFPPYELRRWHINLLNFQVPEEHRKDEPPVVMTCRIDGPSPGLLRRLIDTSVAVEKKGLQGTAYFDARAIQFDPDRPDGFGYAGYDESLREAAQLLKEEAKLPVVLDNKAELFAPGACQDCALYCGWYSHAKFIDSCRCVPGAVAYHIASSEAVSLRDPKSTLWCPNLLQKGAVATLGPVSEPYTIGFPKPAEFYGLLVTGEHTLVECYWQTTYFTSWMTTLVGDPLYNPFKATPKLKVEQVKASPKGVMFKVTKQKKGG